MIRLFSTIKNTIQKCPTLVDRKNDNVQYQEKKTTTRQHRLCVRRDLCGSRKFYLCIELPSRSTGLRPAPHPNALPQTVGHKPDNEVSQ
jgi:hypothetical protein